MRRRWGLNGESWDKGTKASSLREGMVKKLVATPT